MRRKDYAAAVEHWEAALALNPLQPAGWFSLGFACLKAGDTPRALQVGILNPEIPSGPSLVLQRRRMLASSRLRRCSCAKELRLAVQQT